VVTLSPAGGALVPIVQRHDISWTPDARGWQSLREGLSKIDTTSVSLATERQSDQNASVGVMRIDEFAVAHGELPSVRVLREELGEAAALYLREGTSWTIQHGRSEITHRPGEIVIASAGNHQALSTERGRTTGLWVPFNRLTLPDYDLKPLLMQSIPLSLPLRRLLSTSAVELTEAGGADVIGTTHYLSGLADLLLRSILGLNPDHGLTQDARREQIQEYIHGRLADATLTVDSIAEAHYMSRTKLYQIFGNDGVAAYIRHARLDRARQLLADPLRAHETIGSISRQAGFVNQAHFTRSFTREFGVAPREFRAETAVLLSA
jgi:AraC-like DNA-binding protein